MPNKRLCGVSGCKEWAVARLRIKSLHKTRSYIADGWLCARHRDYAQGNAEAELELQRGPKS